MSSPSRGSRCRSSARRTSRAGTASCASTSRSTGSRAGLARWIGLFPAANWLPLAAVLAALRSTPSPVISARGRSGPSRAPALSRCRRSSSIRSLTHLTLSHYWPIPPAILVVSWAFAARSARPALAPLRLAAAVVVVAGLHNIYFAAVLAQFLGARGARAARRPALVAGRPRRRSRCSSCSSRPCWRTTPTCCSRRVHEGSNPAWMRPYGNLERYALKPIELVLPISDGGDRPVARGRRLLHAAALCAASWARATWASPASLRSWRSR